MPTTAEFEELLTNCWWSWEQNYKRSGINGYLLKSKKTGVKLFLPAAGYRRDSDLRDAGDFDNYWSSELYSGGASSARYLHFYSRYRSSYCNRPSTSESARYYGFSVRAVAVSAE